LAPYGSNSANTNVSRSISFSVLDSNGTEISLEANETHPIEIFIPRDPNRIILSMILQNVTSNNSKSHQQLFHFQNI